MKITLKYFIFLLGISTLMLSCQSGKKKVANLAPNAHQVTAEEVIQTSAYTYVRVLDDGKDYWLATNSMDVKKGETYFWSRGGPMQDFTSKELKRTFPVIFFVDDFTDVPITTDQQPAKPSLQAASMAGKQQPPRKEGIKVDPAEGGITIAELYAKKSSLEGKTVKIRGEVIRFAKEIMRKNWVHIQDGTNDAGNYDLTITTLDSVKVGDVVVFNGIISLNKDFGAGYTYSVILEEAKLVKK